MQHPQTFTLPKNPENALKAVISMIEDISTLYTDEIAALKSANTKAFWALQEEKQEKANLYQSGVQQIIQRKKEMKKVNPKIKDRLKDMQKDFHELARINIEEIQRMQRTTNRLGETLRKSAKEAARRMRNINYAQTGHIHQNEDKHVSMSLDETA